MYTIALYYKYVAIDDPESLKLAQKELLERLGAKGRIIVSKEGINGTFEAKNEAVNEYMAYMKSDHRFSDIHWKLSQGTEDGTAFPRLSVKVRKEIVSLHLENDINPNVLTATHLSPSELRSWFTNGKEFYIVDMRNDYELKSGKFEQTIFPGLKNFRDLREKVDELNHLKQKTVLTVCTGGVRCEKASGFLKSKGFEDVYQLDGGIVTYMEQYPGKDFLGSLYVFDKRKIIHFEPKEQHRIIGICEKCNRPSERYENCTNLACHKHFICCDSCLEKTNNHAFCSETCEKVMSNSLT